MFWLCFCQYGCKNEFDGFGVQRVSCDIRVTGVQSVYCDMYDLSCYNVNVCSIFKYKPEYLLTVVLVKPVSNVDIEVLVALSDDRFPNEITWFVCFSRGIILNTNV